MNDGRVRGDWVLLLRAGHLVVEQWFVVERSFEQLASLGSDSVPVPVLDHLFRVEVPEGVES